MDTHLHQVIYSTAFWTKITRFAGTKQNKRTVIKKKAKKKKKKNLQQKEVVLKVKESEESKQRP